MIDIIFLTHNRLEFTHVTLKALLQNTGWSQVRRLLIYDDNSTDGTRQYLKNLEMPSNVEIIHGRWGSPVAIMNAYLTSGKAAEVWAKIDNDTVVPPGWLMECLGVMTRNPDVDLLGIEPFRPIVPGKVRGRGCDQAKFIGGIGLMRSRAFKTLPRPNGRFGFTYWQEHTPGVTPAWLNPALPVFLLDRLPIEPWRGLALEYVRRGWAREWPPYDEAGSEQWNWWFSPRTELLLAK